MSTNYTEPLEEEDAWARLRSKSVGRLAVSHDGQPDIFPVNFLATGPHIVIRTEPGTKLDRIEANHLVAFEADDVSADRAWSVVVKGTASRLQDAAAVESAKRSPLWAYAPGPKDVFIRIEPTEVSGRLFARD